MKIFPLTALIINLLIILVLLNCIFFGGYYLYQRLSNHEAGGLVNFFGYSAEDENLENISSTVAQLLPNIRFAGNNVSYYANTDCPSNTMANFEKAIDIIENETGVISFYTTDKDNAEISVICSNEARETDEGVLIAGEGGPSQYLKKPLYPIILTANVSLYEKSSCFYPVVELHELLHAFGFQHINKSQKILYPYASCNQQLEPEVIEVMKNLYSIERLSDIYFSNITAIRDGNKLNITAEIKNKGLLDSKSSIFNVYADNEKIFTRNLDEITLDAGRVVFLYDAGLKNNLTTIKVEVISTERELSKENNIVELKI